MGLNQRRTSVVSDASDMSHLDLLTVADNKQEIVSSSPPSNSARKLRTYAALSLCIVGTVGFVATNFSSPIFSSEQSGLQSRIMMSGNKPKYYGGSLKLNGTGPCAGARNYLELLNCQEKINAAAAEMAKNAPGVAAWLKTANSSAKGISRGSFSLGRADYSPLHLRNALPERMERKTMRKGEENDTFFSSPEPCTGGEQPSELHDVPDSEFDFMSSVNKHFKSSDWKRVSGSLDHALGAPPAVSKNHFPSVVSAGTNAGLFNELRAKANMRSTSDHDAKMMGEMKQAASAFVSPVDSELQKYMRQYEGNGRNASSSFSEKKGAQDPYTQRLAEEYDARGRLFDVTVQSDKDKTSVVVTK